MNNFDIDEYINRRLGKTTPSKTDDIQAAAANKQASLEETSWVKKLNLNPNDAAGSVVNLAASLASGTSRLIGQVASIPTSMVSAQAEYGVPDEALPAYSRMKQGIATPEDEVLLNQRGLSGLGGDGPTLFEQLQQGERFRGISRDTVNRYDITDIVNQNNRKALSKDLGAGFDKSWNQVKTGYEGFKTGHLIDGTADAVTGLAKLIFNVGESAANNPMAVAEYITENLPQLAVGAVGKLGMAVMSASNVGYGADIYQQGIEAYQASHGGEFPPVAERQRIAMHATGAVLAEQAGDMVGVGAMKTKGLFKAATKTEEVAARTGFKQAILNTGKAAGEGFISEAPTEGYQTYAENSAVGKDTSAKDIYIGGAIGGLSGAGLSGGGRAIAEGVGATPQHAEKRERDRQVEVSTKEAIETGDVSPLLDQKNPAFNPSKAVGVLYANSQREDTAPETKTTNLQKAHEIVSGLEEKRSDLQLELDSYDTNQLETKINTYKEHLAKATDPGLQERLTQAITDTEMDLTEAQTAEATKRAKVLGTQLGLMDQQITSARKVLDQFAGLVQPKEVDIKAAVEAADTIPDAQDTNAVESSKKAVERVLTLAMAHPDSFTTEHLDQLASNTKNGLTEPQRQYLRATSAARIAENALKSTSQVSKEVLEGDPAKNQLGIVDYRKKIGEALLGGNQKRADRFLGMLTSFANNHADKRVLVNKLYQDARSQKTSFDIIPMKGGKWKQTTEQRSEEALRAMGGLRISAASPKLVRAVNVESRALTQAQAALSAAYDLKFTKKATVSQGTSGTSVTSTVDQGQLQSKVDTTVNKTEVPVNTAVATTKKAQEAPNVLSTLAEQYPTDRRGTPVTYRELSDTENTLLTKVKEQLGAMFGAQLEALQGIVILEGSAKPGGRYFSDQGVIGLTPTLFTAKTKLDVNPEARVLRVLAHELAHAQDIKDAEHLDENTLFLSETIAAYHPGGVIHQEVAAAMKGEQAEVVTNWFAYVMQEGQENYWIPSELFAQVRSMYAANPALMKEVLPNVYQTLSATYGTNESTVAETVSRDDGAGSSSTSKESIQDENSQAEEDKVSPGHGVEEPKVPLGKLKLFDRVSDYVGGQLGSIVDAAKGTQLYQKLNLVREMLTQDSKDNTQRPLVMEANFLESWNPENYLGTKPDSKQEALLNDFKAKAIEWMPQIKANLVKGKFVKKLGKVEDNPEFYFNDPVQFLVDTAPDGKANMAENVKLAIAQAAYGHIIENAGGGLLNTLEDIKAMFGVKEYEDLEDTGELYEELIEGWVNEKVIINSLGARVTQALGFQETNKATQDFLPKLQATLGAHVMKLLLDKKILERKEVHTSIIRAAMPERLAQHTVVGDNTKQGFLRFARNPGETFRERTLKDSTQATVNITKETSGVFTKLFGVESAVIEPSWEPITSHQKNTKNTKMGVPSFLKKILKWEDSVPNLLRQDVWNLIGLMDRENYALMSGAVDFDPKTTHDKNQTMYTAINEALFREYDNAVDYFKKVKKESPKGLLQEIFFSHVAWKPQRVGIGSNVLNPQASKLHRGMLYRPEWETEVSLSDSNQMESFALRVAEGLGIKTDKQDNDKALLALDTMLDENSEDSDTRTKAKKLRAAIEAFKFAKTATETLPVEIQQAIVEGVLAGGEKQHSRDSLMALAEMEDAQKANKDTFTVRLMTEVDGVANGPILSHLLLGAANSVAALGDLLNKGGFFRKGDGHKNYNTYRGVAGMRDLYETTTGHMLTKLNTLMDDRISANPDYVDLRPALYAVTGALEKDGAILKAGRNIIKKPLTAMLFGSAMVGVIRSMFSEFVENIYSNFERIAALEGDTQEAARQEFLRHLNQILAVGGYRKTVDITVEQMLKLNIARSPGMAQALENAFNDTYGEAVKQTLESDFSAFLDRRTRINKTAQATFEMYNAVYQAIKESYIQELIDSGEIAYAEGKEGKAARHDLTKEQRKALDERVKTINPRVHTYMSKESNDLDSGIHMSASDRKLATDAAYRSQVKFGSPMEDTGYMNFTTAAYKRIMSSPGVSMVPMLIHALDSAISHMAVMGTQVLNVHDAHGSGLKYILRTAQRLNRMTWKATLHYSPTSEIRDAWKRNLEGMVALLESEKDTKKIVANLRESLVKIADSNKIMGEKRLEAMPIEFILNYMTNSIYLNAYSADKTKYEAMKNMHFVDQYALQNGQYDVSDADRAEAAELSKALVYGVPKDVQALLDKLNTAMGFELIEEAPVSSVWGELSDNPSIKSNVIIEQKFKDKPVMTGAEALQVAYDNLEMYQQKGDFYKALLPQLKKIMPKNLTVRYVTPTTPESDVVKSDRSHASGSRAWFVNTKEGHIYVLSSAFKDSGLTAETLIHEILHGILANTIESNQAPEVRELIADLEALREKAKQYVSKSIPKEDQKLYAPALSNVHEFVSWGMSNTTFQTNVLSNVTMKSKTYKNRLVTGFKEFINTLVSFIFRDSGKSHQAITVNGMTILINNVSGLFNANFNDGAFNQESPLTLSMAAITQSYTTTDLYESLDAGKVTPGFNAHLKSLLSSIVEKIHGPYGSFKESRMKQTALDPLSIITNAMQDGAAPLFRELRTNGISMDDRSAFVGDQVYAAMTAALTDNEGYSTVAARELAKLYNEAYETIKVEDFVDDWSKASQAEKDQATATYNAIFKMEKVSGEKTDHLARFGALGLTHPQFNKLLQFNTKQVNTVKEKTLAEQLQKLFARVLDWINNLVTHTYNGQRADTKLELLVEQLIQIESKKVARLKKKAASTDYVDMADSIAKDLLAKGIGQVSKVVGSSFIRNNKSKVVAATGALARVVANDQVDVFLKVLADYRNKNWQQNLGLMAGLLNNVVGPKKVIEQLLRGSKHIESMRTAVITQTRAAVLNAYANGGEVLTEKANKAITAVLLRTGAHVLLDHMNMVGLHEVVSSRAARLRAIKTLEDQLNVFGNFKKDFLYQSKALAFHIVTGDATSEFLTMNAHNIARLLGTNNPVDITEQEAVKAEPIIDALISLYAIDYTDQHHLNAVANVLSTENARTDGNGVEFSLVLQRKANEQAKEKLFVDAGALMVKGYTPEVFNPYTTVKAANAMEGKHLIGLGYIQGPPLPKDPKDPGQEVRHMYILKDDGLLPYLSGIVSHTGMRHKGTLREDSYIDPTTYTGQQNQLAHNQLTAAKQAAVRHAIDNTPHFDPTKSGKRFMVPVINAQGDTTNWRYMMQEKTKDDLLERDNRSEQVLGMLAGNVFDKESTNTQNRKAIEALHAEFKESFALRADAFVEIGPKAADPVNQEIYRLLPEVTKQAIREVWGNDSMQVPVEMVDVVFGYRKSTISSVFDKVAANRKRKATNPTVDEFEGVNAMEHAIIFGVEWALKNYAKGVLHKTGVEAEQYAKRGAVVVRRAERAWQEAVKITKDIIVVRSGMVMAGNIMSNFSLLKLQGVSWADIIHSHRVGMRGATAYNDDSKKLFQLRTQLESGYSHINVDEVKREILKLEDAIARNPVKELIDAGLMPTIVEDMETATDPYSYKSALLTKMEKYTDKINPKILAAAKTVVVAQDTQLYKTFSEITQLSDFVARYTLYQHLVSRKRNPLDAEAATQEASEAFINYDLPMHRTMQYLDDMGLTMFTKYFLGIQRVLAKNLKEHPLRMLTTLLLDKYLHTTSLVTESAAIFHIGHDPFRAGALQLPGAVWNTAPIQASMSLIK